MDETTKKKYDSIVSGLGSVPFHNRDLLEQLHSSMKLKAAFGEFVAPGAVLKDAMRVHSMFDSLAAVKAFGSSAAIGFAREANLNLGKLVNSSVASDLAEQMKKLTPPWQEKLASAGYMAGSFGNIEAALGLQSHFSKLSSWSILAEKSIANIELSKLGAGFGMTGEFQKALQDNLVGLGNSYAHLFKSLEPPEANVFGFHPVVSSLPPIEYYNDATVSEALVSDSLDWTDDRITADKEISVENGNVLEELLHTIEPDLLKMLEGARSALSSDHPDHVRHFATSLRELHTHVIHMLAPTDAVKLWTTKPEHYDEEGKPTRTARLLYINREINHEPFSDFVNKDIKSTLALLQLLHQGTHEVKAKFTASQLHAMKVRSEGSLRFILEIGLKASGT